MTPTATQTQQCASCRAAVAEDQRYCLSCGARQPSARTRTDYPGPGAGAPPPAAAEFAAATQRDWTPVVALGGLAALALVLVIGVLIGRGGQSSPKTAAAPQVIQLQGGGGAGATGGTGAASGATAAVGKITDEWPSGKSGWTVALQTLAKSGATPGAVTAAKSSATGKGAKNVGVLDASSYTSLGSGYVIYSGVYTSKAQATAALSKLKKSFPGAKVVHVVQPGGGGGGGAGTSAGAPPSAAQQQAGAAAIQSLTNCSGAACSKAARKITQPIATPGAAPKKDNKAAGGGSGGGQSFQ